MRKALFFSTIIQTHANFEKGKQTLLTHVFNSALFLTSKPFLLFTKIICSFLTLCETFKYLLSNTFKGNYRLSKWLLRKTRNVRSLSDQIKRLSCFYICVHPKQNFTNRTSTVKDFHLFSVFLYFKEQNLKQDVEDISTA